MVSTNYILFDPKGYNNLLPLAYTRAIADFRIGIFTIKEKWELHLDKTVEVLTRDYLQALYGLDEISNARNIYINSSILPNRDLVDEIAELKPGQSLSKKGHILAFSTVNFYKSLNKVYVHRDDDVSKQFDKDVTQLKNNWDIFQLNGKEIVADIKHIAISGNGLGAKMALSVTNPEDVYIEQSARIENAILNASEGPVYIGKGVQIMDGAMIRGPVAICDNAVVKMGAKIYGDTTIGPFCKVGGEIGNSVLFAYSNKGHDGYLGNSVLGEWCNLGADTNTSNLKNNYAAVNCWSYAEEGQVDTGLQFCGLIMGDHSKSGINTMFNTGTVVGVSSNIFGSGFPPKFIPSFSWGGSDGITEFRIEKVFEMAERMMTRRNVPFTEINKTILEMIFKNSSHFR